MENNSEYENLSEKDKRKALHIQLYYSNLELQETKKLLLVILKALNEHHETKDLLDDQLSKELKILSDWQKSTFNDL